MEGREGKCSQVVNILSHLLRLVSLSIMKIRFNDDESILIMPYFFR